MILRGLFCGAGGIVLAGLLVSTAIAAPRMEVEVSVVDLASGELVIRMQLHDLEVDPLRLRGVPTYVDNPVARGDVVEGLWIQSGDEGTIAELDQNSRGEQVWTVHPSASDTSIEYRVRADFEAGPMVESYGILVPFMDAERAWFTGNHIFLTPEFSDDRLRDLAADFPVDLSFVLPDSIPLVGPPHELRFGNLHELLSLQFGLGDIEVLEASNGEWESRIALMAPMDFSKKERKRLVDAMDEMSTRAVEFFGGAPFESVTMLVFRAEGTGGLEGSWACQAYARHELDLADERDPKTAKFFAVAFHELVHTWLPIGMIPLEDPWVKEGVTSYYGNVLAARAGWIGPAAVDRLFAGYEDAVFGDVELEEVALSDPRLWYEEYSGENWRRVTYDRGHAVALLLDVHIRTGSDNRHSLDDVMRHLYARHRGESFDREDLLGAIYDATGVDAAGFFVHYVDGEDAPAPSVVDRALQKAVRFGAYDAD